MRIWESAGYWYVNTGTQELQFADFASADKAYRRLQVTSAIVEFQAVMDAIGNQVEAMLPAVDKANDLFMVNQLDKLLEATLAGELVGDSTLTKEALVVYVALLTAFIEFASTPLPGLGGRTPKQVVRLRG